LDIDSSLPDVGAKTSNITVFRFSDDLPVGHFNAQNGEFNSCVYLRQRAGGAIRFAELVSVHNAIFSTISTSTHAVGVAGRRNGL
jgi:hypothetical protein